MPPVLTSTVAVVSPHPDDAALSIGALLACLQKTEIVILTCFSESCAIDPADAPMTTHMRSAEDESYAKHIGARLTRLRFPDTSIRTNRGVEEPRPEQEALLHKELADQLGLALQRLKPSVLLVPLGVGGHVDHVHCRQAVIERGDGRPLIFYEDLPYAQFEGGPAPVRRTVEMSFPLLRAHRVPFTETDMEAKLRGLDFYRSQIHPQWREAVEHYAFALSPPGAAYGERVWSRSPAEVGHGGDASDAFDRYIAPLIGNTDTAMNGWPARSAPLR